MKHIKTFNESSEDYGSMETEYGKFLGIDISDVHDIHFIWSNVPHLSDYRTADNKAGTAEKRMALNSTMRTLLDTHDIKKDQFKDILIERGFDVKIEKARVHPSIASLRSNIDRVTVPRFLPVKSTMYEDNYSVELTGQEVVEFFYLLETYAIQY